MWKRGKGSEEWGVWRSEKGGRLTVREREKDRSAARTLRGKEARGNAGTSILYALYRPYQTATVVMWLDQLDVSYSPANPRFLPFPSHPPFSPRNWSLFMNVTGKCVWDLGDYLLPNSVILSTNNKCRFSVSQYNVTDGRAPIDTFNTFWWLK